MEKKQIQSKYLDLLEGQLSQKESEQILNVIKSSPDLTEDFERYQKLIQLEAQMQKQKFELNENFTVKVMERIDEQSSHGFIKRLIMNFHIPKRMLISGAATLAVCIVVGKIAFDNEQRGVIYKTPATIQNGAKTKAQTEIVSDNQASQTHSIDEITSTAAEKKAGTSNQINPAKKPLGSPVRNEKPAVMGWLAPQQTVPSISSGASEARSNSINAEELYQPIERLKTLESNGYYSDKGRERYGQWTENPVIAVNDEATSTFSIDVDTGSYTNMRRFIEMGQLPPADSVRIEEYINYFKYNYPAQYDKPFSVNYEVAPSPLENGKYLLKLGVKAKDIKNSEKPWNLVFLVDVSGSMMSEDKLELVKKSLHVLLNNMRPGDKVSLVTYAGEAGTLLEGASIKDKELISSKIDTLAAGGSTNGAGGINEAYRIAQAQFIKEGVNRVILATDGDFNVGVTNQDELIKLVEEKRKNGVTLTSLGYGTGNYNEAMMEQIANKGNGNYFYIDSFKEARKVFEIDLFGTIEVVAKDVKLQVEFNPANVSYYRLIGYENRKLNNQDFNNDAIDAGEIGSGHTVTALYEIALTDSDYAKTLQTDSRYQKKTGAPVELNSEHAGELAFLKIRYKQPDANNSVLTEFPISKSEIKDSATSSADFRFAAAVSYFGHLLRNSQYAGKYTFNEIAALAATSLGEDQEGYRREFTELVKNTAALKK